MRNETSHFPTGEAEQLRRREGGRGGGRAKKEGRGQSERGRKGEGCLLGGRTATLYQCSVDQYLATGSTQVDQ